MLLQKASSRGGPFIYRERTKSVSRRRTGHTVIFAYVSISLYNEDMKIQLMKRRWVQVLVFLALTAFSLTLWHLASFAYMKKHKDDLKEGRIILTFDASVDTKGKVEDILKRHNYTLAPGVSILWDTRSVNNKLHFHFANPQKLEQKKMITLLKKIQAAPFISHTAIDGELNPYGGHSLEWMYEWLFQRWYGGEYVDRINAQSIDVTYTNPTREDFVHALAAYEPDLYVLPPSLAADVATSSARLVYGNKENIEALLDLVHAASGTITAVDLAFRDAEITVSLKDHVPYHPVTYILSRYPQLRFGPHKESERTGEVDRLDPLRLEVVVPTGSELNDVFTIGSHPEQFAGIAFASPVYVYPLLEGPWGSGRVSIAGSSMFVTNELVVIINNDTPNEEMIIRTIARETNGEIVGQVAGLGVYEVYFPDLDSNEELEQMRNRILAMVGVESVSRNLLGN